MPAPHDDPRLATLVRLSHLVRRILSEVGRDCGLSPQQIELLLILHGEGPTGMAELRRSLRTGKSGLSELVDRAERKGLVDRTGDPNDRRACRIQLTEAGTRLAALAHHDLTARLDQLTGRLQHDHESWIPSLIAQITALDHEDS